LRATDIFNRRDVARYEEAIAALQQALQRDPKFARAHSRLATLYIVSPGRRSNNQDASLEAKARQYAEQALQLNPALAESHAVLGQLLQAERRFGEAHAAFDRALQLDASDVTTNLWSALSYCITGYTARCRSGLERTLAIDPLLPNALNWRARIAVSDGEIEIAERLMERARGAGLQTGEMVRFWIARKRGDAAEIRNQALEVVRLLQARLPPDAAGWIAEGLAGNADARVRALEAIDEYLVDPPEPISDLVPWALVVLGEVDRGLATFTEFTGSFDGAFLGDFLGARMAPEVWTSPLFPEFLRKTGIAAYWDEFGPPDHCRKLDNGDYRCE
jgi:Tfp pilus assembly protein PilF